FHGPRTGDNTSAQRVIVAKITLRQTLANNRNPRRAVIVTIIEITPREYGYAQSLEKPRPYVVEVDLNLFIILVRNAPWNRDSGGIGQASERCIHGESDGLDTGQGAESGLQLFVEC